MEIGRCSDDGLSNCVPLHDYTPSTRWGYDGLRLLSDDEQVQEIQRAEEGLTIPPCEDQTCPQGWKSGKIFWINAESSQLASSTGKLSHFTNHLTTGIEISPWGRGINFLSRIASGWSSICPCSVTDGRWGWEWHVYQCVAWADSHGMCYEACTLQAELISMITHSFENSERPIVLGSVVSNVYGYWERYVCMGGSWDTPYHLPGRSFLFSFCQQSVSFFLVLSANFAWWARSLLSSKSGESTTQKIRQTRFSNHGGWETI